MIKLQVKLNPNAIKDRVNAIAESFKRGIHNLEVGYFHENSPPHVDENGDSHITIAQLAAMHEYGTHSMPPRPFMSQARATYKRSPGWQAKLKEHYARVIHKPGTAYNFNIEEAIAQDFINHVQNTILAGNFAPLADSTVKKKGHSLPLIDTEQLINGMGWRRTRS